MYLLQTVKFISPLKDARSLHRIYVKRNNQVATKHNLHLNMVTKEIDKS